MKARASAPCAGPLFVTVFSRRTSWGREPTALAERVRQKRTRGESIVDLTQSNPTRCVIDLPVDLAGRLLDNPHAREYHPDPQGIFEARQAIAEWYRRHEVAVQPDSIILTSGTSEAYSFLFTLLCDAGEAVLVPRPSYPLFEFISRRHDVHLMPYDLDYDGQWSIDWSSLDELSDRGPRALIVVHPNNPTGSYVGVEERRRLLPLLQKRSIALIADEVFWTYPLEMERPPASFAGSSENLSFVLSGLSKALGLPHLKLSWVIVAGPEDVKQEALERLEVMGDVSLSVSMPIQAALPGLLERSEEFAHPIRERILLNFAFLKDAVHYSSGLDVLRCEGGWHAVLRVPRIRSDEEWAMLLLDRYNVLVLPGSQFDFTRDGYLVVSLLPEPNAFRKGIRDIVREVAAQARGTGA